MEANPGVAARVNGNCKVPGCEAAFKDSCIEGLTPAECPNFVIGEEAEVVDFVEASSSHEAMAVVGRGGEAFLVDEAHQSMLSLPADRAARVVALIGVPESGKTTLLATVYEMLRRRHAQQISFAGSETIRGFEERCHLSRLASNATAPQTQHTAADLRLMHVSGMRKGLGARVDLFLADRRGELFDRLLDRPTLCGSFVELLRSDCLVFLLDGEQLIKSQTREGAISKIKRLLMAIQQGGALEQTDVVQLVVTKLDMIRESADEALIRKRVAGLVKAFTQIVPTASKFSCHFVAARQRPGTSICHEGLEELVLEWFDSSLKSNLVRPSDYPVGEDAFGRLMLRLSVKR